MSKIFYIYIAKYLWEKLKESPDESLISYKVGNVKNIFSEEIKRGKNSRISFKGNLSDNYIRIKVTLEEN